MQDQKIIIFFYTILYFFVQVWMTFNNEYYHLNITFCSKESDVK